ncbi:MAG: MFS transporter [Arcobacter sp.]|uniref:MFS transporter n=1 Tax=uncultured Arcobacter sp. TaxID=165434 RepID=UPI000CC21F9D|nr:MFS transporter [uncultured Arcobacter sp.]PLY10325.1 MAG: MFS transporter [Arcobacter sp.]
MERTKSVFIAISSLFFSIGFLAIGYGMIMTFVGVFLKENGSSDMVIGLINAAFFLGAMASAIFSQKIISNIGHIRSFVTFASLMVITFLLHSLFLNEAFWAILRLISGFAYYGLLIILESWLNEKSSNEQRGQILAIYTAVFYLSTAVGQLLLNIEDDFKHMIFSIGAVLVLFSVIFIAMTKIKEPILQPFERYSFPKLYNVVPLAVTGSFISGFFIGGFFTMVPLYILKVFDSKEVLSLFMTFTLIGGLLSQWPIGKLSDIYGRRKLISFTGFFTAIISLMFILLPPSETMTYILGVLLGISIFCIYPLSLSRANDVIDENKDIVEISRALLFAYGMGSFFAPVIIGIGFNYLSHQILFIMFLILGVYLALYSLSRKRVEDDHMSVFVSVPVAAGAIVPEFDPRQDQEWVDEQQANN